MAAANRLVAPCSKAALADWWKSTAADRFTKIGAGVLDHRRFWDAMRAVSLDQLAEIEHRLAVADRSRVRPGRLGAGAGHDELRHLHRLHQRQAPIAQRGKAKQKRTDLRLVGLGLVVTRDGGVPLVSHAYPGNRPDVTQFATVVDQLIARHTALSAARRPQRAHRRCGR